MDSHIGPLTEEERFLILNSKTRGIAELCWAIDRALAAEQYWREQAPRSSTMLPLEDWPLCECGERGYQAGNKCFDYFNGTGAHKAGTQALRPEPR